MMVKREVLVLDVKDQWYWHDLAFDARLSAELHVRLE